MATSISLTYFGMPGTGRTVTEAKKDAGAKIEKALTGHYTPRVLNYRGWAFLVYREPHGWASAVIAQPDGFRESLCTRSQNDQTEKEAVAHAQEQLAQLGWEDTDGTEAPAFLTTLQAREFREWAEFQLRFREAVRRGMGHNDAHSYAGRNPTRPELWQNEVA